MSNENLSIYIEQKYNRNYFNFQLLTIFIC